MFRFLQYSNTANFVAAKQLGLFLSGIDKEGIWW